MVSKVWDWNSRNGSFNTQIKIIKIYYKNGDSATASYRALGGDYDLHKRPTTKVIA